MSFINEVFTNIRGLRTFQLEKKTDEIFMDFVVKKLMLIKKSIRLRNTMTILGRTISSIFYFAIIYFSAKFIIEGRLTIGSMVAFNMYMGKLYDVVSRILSMNMNAQSVIVSMDRIDKLKGEPDEQLLYGEASHISGHISGLSISELCFSYKDDLVIDNMSIKFEENGIYSIVGKNGSGKSTFFKILMGFYDYEGQITFTIDNSNKYDLADIGLANLRNKIIYISKDVFILNDTIVNNLKIANQNLTDREIIERCNSIGYNTFIDTLPEGYETILSERGENFSSGQKQKVNAIRAYLTDADIILLDEITSDLDGISEIEIMDIINEISKTKLVLFISHKITSVMDSKRIYVFNEGIIIDNGKHDELMTRCALYRELFWLDRNAEK